MRKKLFFFLESLSGGGAEKALSDFIAKADKTKYDITVGTVVDVGVYRDDIRKHCKYVSLLPDQGKMKGAFRRLLYKLKYKLVYRLPPAWVYKLLVKERYDCEIAFIEGFATKVIASSTNRTSKKLAWVHTDLIEHNYADAYYANREAQVKAYKAFDNIVCVSENVKQAFERKLFRHPGLVVKYNPVDSESIQRKGSSKSVRRGAEKVLLVTVGRLAPAKGYDRLLRVVHQLIAEGAHLELWVLGEGEERERLEKYIQQNGLAEHVYLKGFQSNPYPYVRMCDIFVCSSIAEGYSLAIAEAMVLGLPVISTKSAGPNEILELGEYGLLVENNEEALYEGLLQLVSNEALRTYYRGKSLERSQCFNIRQAVAEIEKLFA